MADKIATRAAFGEAIVELAEQYPELVVLDADLSGATMTKNFSKAYPERFFNMGIAESNMVGVAAGLATCGKKPFAATFAMFAAGRAFEQVRNSVAYPISAARTSPPCAPFPACWCAAPATATR